MEMSTRTNRNEPSFPRSAWERVNSSLLTRFNTEGDIMKTFLTSRISLVFVATVAVVALIVMARLQPAKAERVEGAAAAGGPHYTVVETEGHNLVVTDNESNTLYFYTVDKGKAPGSELKLRAKVDLTKVGKPSIMPEDINIQK
jgi:hypothetical protein